MNNNIKKDGFLSQKLLVLPQDFILGANNNSLSENVYPTDIGYFPNAQYHYINRITGISSYIIIFCQSGTGFFSQNGGEQKQISPGQVIVIPPNTPHSYGSDNNNPWSIYWIHIGGNGANKISEQINSNIPIDLSILNQSKYIELFEELYETLDLDTCGSIIYASKITEHILGLIYNCSVNHQLKPKTNYTVEKIISYMSQHIDKNVTLEELSTLTRFSVPHINTVFKKATGSTPINYFLRMKIIKCCKYLDFTDLSIKEISEKYGFSDPYYFSRLFKKIMGVSPNNYRNIQKG